MNETDSMYAVAQKEADTHKWIRSQEAGRDLGEEAVRDWVQQHWHDYLRARWLEHIQGTRFWSELERSDFGLLQRLFPNDPLLETVLTRLKAGKENLDIIHWATENHIPTEVICQILCAIDINRIRLFRFFGN